MYIFEFPRIHDGRSRNIYHNSKVYTNMAPPKKQLTLFVDFWIDPSLIEDFKAAHRPVWAACAAEPECLLFDVFQDPAEPGRFRFVEVWSEGRE